MTQPRGRAGPALTGLVPAADGVDEGIAAMAHAANKRRGISEKDALRHVVARLAEQFPELSAEQIDQAVAGHYAAFEHSPIRDFVPILVERASRDQLTAQHPRHRA